MPLSDIQRITLPFAKGTLWRKWWYEYGHHAVSEAEKREWLKRLEREAADLAVKKGERKKR